MHMVHMCLLYIHSTHRDLKILDYFLSSNNSNINQVWHNEISEARCCWRLLHHCKSGARVVLSGAAPLGAKCKSVGTTSAKCKSVGTQCKSVGTLVFASEVLHIEMSEAKSRRRVVQECPAAPLQQCTYSICILSHCMIAPQRSRRVEYIYKRHTWIIQTDMRCFRNSVEYI